MLVPSKIEVGKARDSGALPVIPEKTSPKEETVDEINNNCIQPMARRSLVIGVDLRGMVLEISVASYD